MSTTSTRMSRAEQQRRRLAAVAFVEAGQTQAAAAQAFGVTQGAVSNWVRAKRKRGAVGLRARYGSGRRPKLSRSQERQVLGWFARPATDFGFANELWTAPRVAQLIRKKFDVEFHPRYVNAWLAQRRITPQKPRRRPRERDDERIEKYRRYDWPQLKNGPAGAVRSSF